MSAVLSTCPLCQKPLVIDMCETHGRVGMVGGHVLTEGDDGNVVIWIIFDFVAISMTGQELLDAFAWLNLRNVNDYIDALQHAPAPEVGP